jgi:putative oxidoreductase
MARSAQRLTFGGIGAASDARAGSFSAVVVAGRTLLGAIFLLSGISKVMDWSSSAAYMEAQGFVAVPFFLAAAALIEIVGGLAVITGTAARLAAVVLILFLIPTTVIFHDFWALEGAERQNQMNHFLKNLSIMGGLLVLFGFGAGRFSVDTKLERRYGR